MTIERYTGGFTATHGYLVTSNDSAVLIDAPEGIADWLLERGVVPAALLLTHQHFDHVLDAGTLQSSGIPIHAWSAYSPSLTLEDQAQQWGLPITIAPYRVDHILEGRPEVEIKGFSFSLLPVPGHSPDSVVFHSQAHGVAFAGDTLFAGSIGRTDLPHGDHPALLAGIRNHLFPLPAETRVLPGHGGETTIRREQATNPYLRSEPR